MKMCGQNKCDEPAAYAYVWPGKAEESFVCFDHAVTLKRLGLVMGVEFPVRLLDGQYPETTS